MIVSQATHKIWELFCIQITTWLNGGKESMMINLELALAKYIIIVLLVIIGVLILVIVAQGKQINKILNDELQEKKRKDDCD